MTVEKERNFFKRENRGFKEKKGKKEKRVVKKPVQSTQMNLPIREIAHGIIVTKDERYVQILEVIPSNFQMASEAAKQSIISAFEALLKICPRKIQFKCITCPANMEAQLSRIAGDMIVETNDNCYDLQQEQIELFRRVSRQGISRRFFIAYEYEKKNRFKKPNIIEIEESLKTTRNQIAAYLESCGNRIVVVEDVTEQVGSILYTILNRKTSEKTSFLERVSEVFRRYVDSTKLNDGEVPYIPPTEFIAPNRIDLQNPEFISVDGIYYSFCYIPSNGYVPRVIAGWLDGFINLGDGIDIDIFLTRMDKNSIMPRIQQSVKFNRMSRMDTRDTQGASYRLDKAIDSGQYLIEGLQNYEDFFYANIMITIMGDTPQIVADRIDEIEKIVKSRDMKLQVFRYQQEEAFISSLPLCNLAPNLFEKSKRNILTSGAGSLYPFMSYELNDANGILWGVQYGNLSPVVIDIFDHSKYTASNLFISGVSGSGKSSILKALALRSRMRHIPAYIIVPEKQDEFRRVCTAVGGQFIELGAGSPTRINILEIFKRDESVMELIEEYTIQTSLLASKVQELKKFFQLLIPDISQAEKQLLDEALIKTYRIKGITADNNSLIDPLNPTRFKKDMPIIGDLYRVLKEDSRTERLATIINMFVSGSASSFNGLTNVDLSNDFIAIGLEKTDEELLPASMYLAIDFLFSKIKEDKSKHKILFVEEVWKLMLNKQAAEKLLEIAKIIRAYGGSLTLATQQFQDIIRLNGGEYGQGIINSCTFKIVLRHEETDIDMLVNSMKLSPQQLEGITSFYPGLGLIIAGNNSVKVDFALAPKEYEIITTNPRDLAKRKERMLQQQKQNKSDNNNEIVFVDISGLEVTDFSFVEESDSAEVTDIEISEFEFI